MSNIVSKSEELDEKEIKVFFIDGTTRTMYGEHFEDAFEKAGYGPADYYDVMYYEEF
jgi:hypothetical protein